MNIDGKTRHIWQTIKGQHKTAFFSCLIVGYLMHLYAFTKFIPNSDGLSRIYDTQQLTISGGDWFIIAVIFSDCL